MTETVREAVAVDEKGLEAAAEAQLNEHRRARGWPPTTLAAMQDEHRAEWMAEARAAISAYLSATGWWTVVEAPTLDTETGRWSQKVNFAPRSSFVVQRTSTPASADDRMKVAVEALERATGLLLGVETATASKAETIRNIFAARVAISGALASIRAQEG